MDEQGTDLDQVAIANFRSYLQFPTVHPEPCYDQAVKWLCSQADSLNLWYRITEIVPKNPILLMRWEGSDPSLPAILLNSHMDVVPVDESRWTYPPFTAQIGPDNKIFARGSQDMKCVGIQQLEAVRRLRARGIKQLRRTIYLSFVPDEELGGKRGMQPFVEGRESTVQPSEGVHFSELNIGLCLDEGIPSPTEDYLAYFEERRQCWFIAHFRGVAGHGLTLMDGTAGEKLQGFLNRIMQFRAEEKQKVDELGGSLHLGDVTSVNLTMLKGGSQHNVLPSTLSAWFDVRLTPTRSLDSFKSQLNQWAEEVGGDIEFEFVNIGFDATTTSNKRDEQVWSTLQSICSKFGAKIQKKIFPGGTDARFIRQYHMLPTTPEGTKPICAVGFTPVRHTPILLHDHDEYLSIEEFLQGCRIYTELLQALSELPDI